MKKIVTCPVCGKKIFKAEGVNDMEIPCSFCKNKIIVNLVKDELVVSIQTPVKATERL